MLFILLSFYSQKIMTSLNDNEIILSWQFLYSFVTKKTLTSHKESVTLQGDNRRMKIKFFLLSACWAFPHVTYADVLIDLDNAAEIGISNTQQTNHYTVKIEEPLALNTPPQSTTAALKYLKHNSLPYHSEVLLAAQETAIEPALLHAIIKVESNHNATSLSKKGAYGLMQLMPETASRFNVRNKNDPQQNILAGARYMRELLTKYNGDVNLSLAAYNAGPAALQKYGGKIPPYRETLSYVPKVLKYYRQYS
jgi:hypothetical protein